MEHCRDNSKSNYAVTNEITYNTENLKSCLYDYSNAYLLVRVDIIATVIAAPQTQVAFKNCTPNNVSQKLMKQQ